MTACTCMPYEPDPWCPQHGQPARKTCPDCGFECGHDPQCRQRRLAEERAASELGRLRASNARLIEALRPFAEHHYDHDKHMYLKAPVDDCTCKECNAARVLREVTNG